MKQKNLTGEGGYEIIKNTVPSLYSTIIQLSRYLLWQSYSLYDMNEPKVKTIFELWSVKHVVHGLDQ